MLHLRSSNVLGVPQHAQLWGGRGGGTQWVQRQVCSIASSSSDRRDRTPTGFDFKRIQIRCLEHGYQSVVLLATKIFHWKQTARLQTKCVNKLSLRSNSFAYVKLVFVWSSIVLLMWNRFRVWRVVALHTHNWSCWDNSQTCLCKTDVFVKGVRFASVFC